MPPYTPASPSPQTAAKIDKLRDELMALDAPAVMLDSLMAPES
ncbi:MAG: hypothetical protein ACLSHC_16835 [Bilophila wadsworthia]